MWGTVHPTPFIKPHCCRETCRKSYSVCWGGRAGSQPEPCRRICGFSLRGQLSPTPSDCAVHSDRLSTVWLQQDFACKDQSSCLTVLNNKECVHTPAGWISFCFVFCGARNGPPRAAVGLVSLYNSHILGPGWILNRKSQGMIISNLLTVNAQCTLYVSPCFLEVYNLKDKLRGHWVHLILLHINFFI